MSKLFSSIVILLFCFHLSISYAQNEEVDLDSLISNHDIHFSSEEERLAFKKLLEDPHDVIDYLNSTTDSHVSFEDKVKLYLSNNENIVKSKEDLDEKIKYLLMTVNGGLLKYGTYSTIKKFNENFEYNEYIGALYFGTILYRLEIPFYLFFKDQIPYFNVYPHIKDYFVSISPHGLKIEDKEALKHDDSLITYQFTDSLTN
ncbi:hypothetical protein [Flammeovirga sp. EKP202]|uniref:hypothetical protein n=1 Tax=Flammeovirga sp. EKP202 TaxID=2770592 RepID=UPI00165F2967|nr:hypothetical protein [Flammeovirga sp. EKP202]MBD0405222.1 hypothetical protein [Flammeovirga sp. EKP202]